MTGQIAQVLAHLGGPGRAVQPDQVDAERLKCGQGRADLAAEQHRAGGLDRHRRDQRHAGPGLGDGPLHADDGRLGLQQVLAGLDDDRVHPAAKQACGVALVGVTQRGEPDVPEGGQLGAGPDRAEHPARPLRRRPRVRGLPGDPRACLGQLPDPVLKTVFAEVAQVRAEGVGGDAVHPGFEVAVVDRADDVGPGEVEDFVAPLVAVEVAEGRRAGLEHGAHRPVGHHHPLGQGGPERFRRPSGPQVRVAGLAVVPRHRVPSLNAGPSGPRPVTKNGALSNRGPGVVPPGQHRRCGAGPAR